VVGSALQQVGMFQKHSIMSLKKGGGDPLESFVVDIKLILNEIFGWS
jgi:hypothetical protein